MKIKKVNQKLTLNKKTIASLNDIDMNSVKGGFISYLSRCDSDMDCTSSCVVGGCCY